MKSTSPKSGKRACMCKNGNYSRKCCKGKIINQGIGSLEDGGNGIVIRENTVKTTTRN